MEHQPQRTPLLELQLLCERIVELQLQQFVVDYFLNYFLMRNNYDFFVCLFNEYFLLSMHHLFGSIFPNNTLASSGVSSTVDDTTSWQMLRVFYRRTAYHRSTWG